MMAASRDLSLKNSVPNEGEIILYQPNDQLRLEVKIEDDTVWLTQSQIADLFGVQQPAISKHLNNIFREGELDKDSVHSILEYTASDGKRYQTQFYNLDAILSVGYRVNSVNATQFRRWATTVLRDYMLRGYAVNQRMLAMEERIDKRLTQHERILSEHQDKIDFFVRSSLPPAEQVFYNGEFFSARVALENIVKSAEKRVVIIDGYVDAQTFDILDVRRKGVLADIYTNGVGEGMRRLITKHDAQKDRDHIEVHKWRNESHDRWLIIDDTLYHCGPSLNEAGRTLCAITKMGLLPEDILENIIER